MKQAFIITTRIPRHLGYLAAGLNNQRTQIAAADFPLHEVCNDLCNHVLQINPTMVLIHLIDKG